MIELDSVIFSKERVHAVGAGAALVNLSAVSHVRAHRSGGFLPSEALAEVVEPLRDLAVLDSRHRTFDGFTPLPDAAGELVERLTAEGLWSPVGQEGWIVEDALRPTSSEVVDGWLRTERERSRWRLKKRRSRGQESGPGDQPDSVPGTPHAAFSPPIESSGPNGSVSKQLSDGSAAAAVLPDHDQLAARVAGFDAAVAQGGDVLIGHVLSELRTGVQPNRTPAAVRSVLETWDLPDQALVDALARVRRKRERGDEFFQSEASYFVACLRRMGEEGAYRRPAS